MDVAEVLHRIPELATLPASDLNALAQQFTTVTVAAGNALPDAGRSSGVYLLLEGELAAGRSLGESRRTPGALGLAVLPASGASAAALRALKDSRIAVLTSDGVERMAGINEATALALELAVSRDLARQMREVSGRLKGLLSERASESRVLDYDVAVIGAGPIGLAYATWVKNTRPSTRVAVLERKANPGFKIGESALGPANRMILSMGLTQPMMRRLFDNKMGFAMWWAGRDTDEIGPHIDLANVDETFHVERSVMEEALHKVLRRRGDIDFLTATTVKVADSDLDSQPNVLACEAADGEEFLVRASVVCDASGPASVVPRARGLYRKKIDSFNTNAYFGYYREKTVDLEHWDVPTTGHLIVPEGWMWFIRLVSWESSPPEKLSAMIDRLLDYGDASEDEMPTRQDLAEEFGCTCEDTVSIGIVVRDDEDTSKSLPVGERFDYWVNKYPGVKRVMDRYELIEQPYEKHRRFSAYLRPAHDCERVTGDGWLAIGDAAYWVNPLLSTGMSFGAGAAFTAANDTVRALDSGDFSSRSFATYERYGHEAFDQLLRENDAYYRSFKNPELFEKVLQMKIFFGMSLKPPAPVPLSSPTAPYRDDDPNFVGLLERRWWDIVTQVMEVEREGEASGRDAQETLEIVRPMVDGFVQGIFGRMPAPLRDHVQAFMTHYDENAQRVEKKDLGLDAVHVPWQCSTCRHWTMPADPRCYVCGTDRDEVVSTAGAR